MSGRLHKILQQYWGYEEFRPLQEDIIKSAVNKKDTLALLPTGGGKSICFQVPAMAMEGICIVISPLIALMRDQVDNLKKRGIKAVSIHSGLTKREIDILLDNCIYGDIKFLYVSPERLKTEIFITRMKKMNVNLIAIDEAHCISQWGYDFRPSYLEIAKLKDHLPNVPFLALTATATPKVVVDIQHKLNFKKENLFQKSFERTNIQYIVINEEDKIGRMMKIIQKVPGTGLIYVKSRKKTQEIAHYLQKRNISADFYHAGLTAELRAQKQADWIDDKIKIIVATNAFGMGIDKPNVRFVINFDLPATLEAYFQEAGRAGRDEQKAYATLLVNEADKDELIANVENKFPSKDIIKKIYFALGNHFRIAIGAGEGVSLPLNMEDIKQDTGMSLLDIYNSILFLERAGYFELSEAFYNPSRVKIEMNQTELYDFQLRNKKFDPYIKLLLRSYGGLFDSFSKIKEFDLAKRSKQSVKTVQNVLTLLDQMEVITYEPATDLPYLTYMTPRADTKYLRIDKAIYEDRKQDALEKVNSAIKYAFSDVQCRSQLLLSYFGETDANTCGHCDVCLNKTKESKLPDDEAKLLESEIIDILKNEASEINDLIDFLSSKYDEKKIRKMVQWLLSCNKIRLNEFNQLILH